MMLAARLSSPPPPATLYSLVDRPWSRGAHEEFDYAENICVNVRPFAPQGQPQIKPGMIELPSRGLGRQFSSKEDNSLPVPAGRAVAAADRTRTDSFEGARDPFGMA